MFKLPKLQFDYSSLEPHLDKETVILHHTKHHQAYIDKLNAGLEKYPNLANKKIEELLSNIDSLPQEVRLVVRNHGGGHANHSFFWNVLSPKKQEPISTIDKEEFFKAALSVFGSGWAWVVKDSQNKLKIITTPNQDSPLSQNLKPVLGIDVWEHAYYLKYQNRRAEYLEAFWNVIDWNQVKLNLK